MQSINRKSYSNSGNDDALKYIIQPPKVLDFGCGAGDNAKILKNNGFTVDGITISNTELLLAKPFFNKGYLFNLESGLPDEVKSTKYDYIICSHVLEHS